MHSVVIRLNTVLYLLHFQKGNTGISVEWKNDISHWDILLIEKYLPSGIIFCPILDLLYFNMTS